MPTSDDHHRRNRSSPLTALQSTRQGVDDSFDPPNLSRQHHPVHAMADNRPSASSYDPSRNASSPSMATAPSVTDSNTTKTKGKRGLKNFLTLKEPSTSAFEQYAHQMKAETGITRGPSGPSGSGISSRKLPKNVPKVNSKWNGLPNAASDRHSSSSSMKRSKEGSQKRSDVGWTPPASSEARSPGSRKKAASDDTLRRKSSSKRSARLDDRHRPEPQPLSINAQARPDSTIQIVPAMSTHTRDEDDDDFGESSAIPEMSLFWPPSYDSPDPIQSAGGISETSHPPARKPAAPAGAMPFSLPSDSSSPNMPQTPEDEDPLPIGSKQKANGQTTITHSRDSSADSGPEWPFPTIEPDYSARTSMSDNAPPPIPTKSHRRRSFESFSSHTHTASDATDRQLDGSSQITPTDSLLSRTRSFSRPRFQKRDGQNVTRIWSSSEGEGDEIDSVDVPRYKPSTATSSKIRSNFSRPITPGGRLDDSVDGPETTPTSTRSDIRSFSRPTLSKRNSPNSPSAPTTMGAPSIIRNGQHATGAAVATTSSFSESAVEAPAFGRLGMVPPRFQPGRVIVKDSDLDTIAEADSVYSSSIHQDSRRNSYASTIAADIPRRRPEGPRFESRDQYDGTADDESESDDDDSSLRTSTYGFSEDEADSIHEAAAIIPGRFQDISPAGTGLRSSYYANALTANDYDSPLVNDAPPNDSAHDSSTESGDETEREDDQHPDLDDDTVSYHAHLSDISSSSSHAHAMRRARERNQSYDPGKITAITGEDPIDRPGTPDTFDLSYGMPDLPNHDLDQTVDGAADTHRLADDSLKNDTEDFARASHPPTNPQHLAPSPTHTLSAQPSFTSQTSQTPSQLDSDAISLADSSYTLDSLHSNASHLTASWYKSPRERLGLGGFIRHSGVEVPWNEIPRSPPSSSDRPAQTSPSMARAVSKDNSTILGQPTGPASEVGKDSSAMIRYMLQSHDGASDRPGGSTILPLRGSKTVAVGKEDPGLRKSVGRKSLLGFRLLRAG